MKPHIIAVHGGPTGYDAQLRRGYSRDMPWIKQGHDFLHIKSAVSDTTQHITFFEVSEHHSQHYIQ